MRFTKKDRKTLHLALEEYIRNSFSDQEEEQYLLNLYNRVSDIEDYKKLNKDEMSITWCVEDIWGIDDSLTKEQCREVLESAKQGHDANIGINWNVLGYHIDRVKGRK